MFFENQILFVLDRQFLWEPKGSFVHIYRQTQTSSTSRLPFSLRTDEFFNRLRDYKESLFEDLKDPKFVVAYLNAALEEGTQEVFLLHLRDVADAWGGLGKLATETSLAYEALYRMLSEQGNPQLSSLEKILQVLGLRLAVTRAS